MNKKLLIGILVLVILTFGLWLVLRPNRENASTTEVLKSTPSPFAGQTQPSITNRIPGSFALPKEGGETQSMTSEQREARFIEKSREIAKSLNRPISFYGHILDQYDQAIAGVQIEGHYKFFSLALPGAPSEQEKVAFTSDANGKFQFKGVDGLTLYLQLQPDEGYEFKDQGVLGISFQEVGSPPISTPEKPYIFHAFKKGETEPLIVGGMSFYDCIPDGRWYTADLKGKRKIDGAGNGEFKISMTRPPGVMGHTNLDWSVQIEGIYVDLIDEANDPFMYQAPESGYQSLWSYAQRAGEPKYKREASPKFYLRARDGSMYGRVEMRIMADSRTGYSVQMQYWLNPFGSRNVEYDKNKQITPELIKRVGLEKAIQQVKHDSEQVRPSNLTPEQQEQQDLEDLRTNRGAR